MSRGFLLSFIALGVALAVLFAVLPSWDIEVAAWFFDPGSGKFPLSTDDDWKTVRQAANYVPFILVAPAVFTLAYKLATPSGPLRPPRSRRRKSGRLRSVRRLFGTAVGACGVRVPFRQ